MPLSGWSILRQMRVGPNGCSAVPDWPESPCFWVERETCSLPAVELSHWKVQQVTEKLGQHRAGQHALAGFCSWALSTKESSTWCVTHSWGWIMALLTFHASPRAMGHLFATVIQKYHLWGDSWSHEIQSILKLLECLSARESVFHQLPDTAACNHCLLGMCCGTGPGWVLRP